MSAALAIAISGILATAAMTGVLYLIHTAGLANADMLRAIGTIVTRQDSRSKAAVIGTAVHFVIGVIFAFFYVGMWSLFNFNATWEYIAVGAVIGFAHGLVVSIALINLVAEHHPVDRYREAGFGVATAHLGAHIIYGLCLGLAISFFNRSYGTMEEVAQVVRPIVFGEDTSVAH